MLRHPDRGLAVASADLGKANFRSTCGAAHTLGLVKHRTRTECIPLSAGLAVDASWPPKALFCPRRIKSKDNSSTRRLVGCTVLTADKMVCCQPGVWKGFLTV